MPPRTATRRDVFSMVWPMLRYRHAGARMHDQRLTRAAMVGKGGMLKSRLLPQTVPPMSHDRLVSCPGVLALELAPGSAPARVALERDEAEQLAAFMADDLGALL